MANEYVLSLAGITATEFEMRKKAFALTTLRAYRPELFAYNMISNEDMMGGISKDTFRYWKMTADRKLPHAEIAKQNLQKMAINIRYEDNEIISATNLSIQDAIMTHFDARGEAAFMAGQAIAQDFDIHAIVANLLAARTAAHTVGGVTFPGGQRVSRVQAALDQELAYPMSVVGSQAFQQDIRSANRLAFEDNVPEPSAVGGLQRFCFCSKWMHDVLLEDDSIMSRDFVGVDFSDKIKGKVTMVDDTWIIPTNNYPGDRSAETHPYKRGALIYNGDYSESVAIITNSDACRKAEGERITPILFFDDDRRSWVIGASGLKGIDSYKVENAREIYLVVA